MKRTILFLVAALLLPLAAAELTDAQWAQLKQEAKNRQRYVIYDNDDDDLLCFPKDKEFTVENYLALRTSFLHNYPVDSMVVNANYGAFQQLIFPNDNGELADFAWGPESRGINAIPYFLARGIDPFAEQIAYARAHNIEFFAGMRINDTHDYADTPDKPVIYFSSWKRCHPQFLMGSHTQKPRNATWSSYDFTHPEVRDKFVAVCVEIAQRYPIDGLAVDMHRWMGTFKSVAYGGEASDEETEMFSEMFRRIRRETERIGRERGRPIMIAVRVPDEPRWSRGIGLDWEGLMREGVLDVIFLGGNTHLQPWKDSVALCHKYDVKCYASIDMPSFAGPTTLSRFTQAAYDARCAGALASGVDGLYYFNLFYESAVKGYMHGAPENYRLKNKSYFITERLLGGPSSQLATGAKYCTLPYLAPTAHQWVKPDHRRDFILEFGDDIAALNAEGRDAQVTATLLADIRAGSLVVSSNGKEWKLLSGKDGVYSYEVPADALKPGPNTVSFTCLGTPGKKVPRVIMSGKILLKGEHQPPWRRAYGGNADNSELETLAEGAVRLKDRGKGLFTLIYPFAMAGDPSEVDLVFETRCEDVNAPLGASVRVAFGGKVETLDFQPNEIRLVYAGKSAPVDTAHFHKYHLHMDASRITVSVDGKELLAADVTARSAAPENLLPGPEASVDGMQESSIMFGSLADEGTGTSFWKNVTLMGDEGEIVLKDLQVDVRIGNGSAFVGKIPWQKQATEGNALQAGNFAFQCPKIVAEADVVVEGDKPTTILLSSGGIYYQIDLYRDKVMIPTFNNATLPLPQSEGPVTVRATLENERDGIVTVNGRRLDVRGMNVSMALNGNVPGFDPAVVTPEAMPAFRQSGVIVIDPQAVRGLRTYVVKP